MDTFHKNYFPKILSHAHLNTKNTVMVVGQDENIHIKSALFSYQAGLGENESKTVCLDVEYETN